MKIPWRRAWQSTSVFLPGESSRTEGYSPRGRKESDMTQQPARHSTNILKSTTQSPRFCFSILLRTFPAKSANSISSSCVWEKQPLGMKVQRVVVRSVSLLFWSIVALQSVQQSESAVHMHTFPPSFFFFKDFLHF